ncbi:MAG: hypothetical protein OXD45_06335 [Rhodobacteraceae bacterium]|nr:hypothetical protein [Paracoccaceae bacterium]MCY4307436.1 hypothetical protein [Paracoccaceae bacterium]
MPTLSGFVTDGAAFRLSALDESATILSPFLSFSWAALTSLMAVARSRCSG